MGKMIKRGKGVARGHQNKVKKVLADAEVVVWEGTWEGVPA